MSAGCKHVHDRWRGRRGDGRCDREQGCHAEGVDQQSGGRGSADSPARSPANCDGPLQPPIVCRDLPDHLPSEPFRRGCRAGGSAAPNGECWSAGWTRQVKEACGGWAKPARVLVERHQVRFVVDVQPLAAGRCDLFGEEIDQGARDAAPLTCGVDDGIEEEGVKAAVPAGMHESNQRVTAKGAHPGQAVLFQPY